MVIICLLFAFFAVDLPLAQAAVGVSQVEVAGTDSLSLSQGVSDTTLAQAISLYEGGEYALAREKIAEYLSSNADDPRALFYMGKLEADGIKSQEYFRLLLNRYPESELADDALFEIARFWYAKGYYITTQQHLLRLLRDYPNSDLADRIHYQLGLTFLATDKPEQAREEFQKLVEQYPESPLKLYGEVGIFDSFYAGKEYEKAIVFGEGLVDRAGPLKSHLLYALSDCYRKLGRKEETDRVLARLSRECPGSYETTLVPDTTAVGADSLVSAPEAALADSTPHYYLQAGAFENIANATALHNRLTSEGYEVRLKTKIVDGTLLYLVWVGPYEERETAEDFARKIRAREGIKCYILKNP